jgi:hypothetical protein
VAGELVRLRLTGVGDDIVVVWAGDRSHAVAELAREEVYPLLIS